MANAQLDAYSSPVQSFITNHISVENAARVYNGLTASLVALDLFKEIAAGNVNPISILEKGSDILVHSLQATLTKNSSETMKKVALVANQVRMVSIVGFVSTGLTTIKPEILNPIDILNHLGNIAVIKYFLKSTPKVAQE